MRRDSAGGRVAEAIPARRHPHAEAEAPVLLVETKVQLDKVLAVRRELPDLKWIVTMRGAPEVEDPQVLTWDEFLAMGVGVPDAEFDARVAALEPEGLATLIYTP